MTRDNEEKRFETPVDVRIDGTSRQVATVQEAIDLLSETGWPGERGPRHRDAMETCMKVLEGHRSTIDARMRFFEAAREAGIAR